MSQVALSIQAVTKAYGDQVAVSDVSLDIQAGEIFGLLGPNGAGKSSLINMISGLARISHGTIGIFGYDNQRDFKVTRRMTGVMPQEIVIDNFFTLDESLRLHAGYYGFRDDASWRRTLIERLALGPYLKKTPLQLSGGTKRRHMLAKALIHRPQLLILDEPTAGVDVELRQNIWSFVREINKMGTTVLLTTHYLEEAEQMCGRIGILSQGKIVALSRTADLLNRIDDRKLSLRVESPLAADSPILAELNAQLSEEGHLLTIPLRSANVLAEILQRLPTLPLKILDIQSKSADLEEVFLSLTGNHARV